MRSHRDIKPFKMEDLGYFIPNRFSDPDNILDQLTDPNIEIDTVWNDGMVAALVCYHNYWGNCWRGFFLIAEDFPPRLAFLLRDHVRGLMVQKNAMRLQTDSVSCPELTKWHEFMGFKFEGTREKMLFDQDYDMWAIIRGVN